MFSLRHLLGLMAFVLLMQAGAARAQDAGQQQALFQRMMQQPTNHEITYEYARVATARGDYEAAIGALERLLYYNPRLTQVKYELGALYFRLGSYSMAKRYFKEALASPDLDATTRARIEAYLPDADKQLQNSRLSGFVQTGIRSQSNANYAPSGGAILFNGNPLSLAPNAQKKSDVNWFGLAGISHDYDLNSQRGDTLETRFIGYMTRQDRFSQLDVGLFDASFGPRLSLNELWQGATIKPYVVGGNTWLDNKSYLGSVGAGLDLRLPMANHWTVAPGFEWRRNDFTLGTVTPVTPFNSGDSYTASLGGTWQATQTIRLDTRGFYRRGDAQMVFNTFDQWGAEAALSFEFSPPFVGITRNWSVAPFVKLLDTKFGGPNPFIDPLNTQHDTMWSTGAIFNAPINSWFGLSTAVQYDHTDSTIQNYRLNNFSVMFGPTARF
ncbi:MAG: tetratricopeptide repeat protein [Xanthobacteraceae bacterium]|nr:tetratricopeptide repeat protein [Xanthobacteraceae bacterium]